MALETRTTTESLSFVPSDTQDLSIILDIQRSKGRQRSNSKVYNNNGESSTKSVNTKENEVVEVPITDVKVKKQHFERENYIYILSLVSMNGTFDRKTLKIPDHPSVLKLGRPTNTQRTPNIYNGYFDSRVISREHAEVYVKKGKLYINDLKSANGTFLNGESIRSEKELKVGDMFDLGIDISNDNKHQHQQQQHLKISCKVEGFLSFPLDGVTDTKKLLENVNKDFNKQYKDGINDNDDEGPKLSLFDAAMFGDVNHDLEDIELGLNHDYLTGIFVNNNIGTSSNLIQSIKILIDQVHSIKLNNLKLESIESFLQDYKSYLNKDKQLIHIQESNNNKQEIKQLNEKLKNLDSLLLQKENEIKQLKLNSIASNLKMKELENDKNNTINSQNDSITLLELKITDQIKQIENLNKNKIKISNDFDEKLKKLETEIKEKDQLIKTLVQYKEDSKKNQVFKDMANLSIIIIAVLVIGITTLKVF